MKAVVYDAEGAPGMGEFDQPPLNSATLSLMDRWLSGRGDSFAPTCAALRWITAFSPLPNNSATSGQ